ncbi:DUF1704 domain-containing protein [Candidatus Peregrinibacteria bacterium]|nr:DUF1704 domain-containing protein [Candidatus Peregrinibacteria bacterium]
MWFLHNPGLLGINARNLLYIKAYNPEKAILMADSKLKTKHFLSARGIPVAKLYGVIRNKMDLKEFRWDQLPPSFAVKPNSGYGGEGILIIEKRDSEGNLITPAGEIITQKALNRHINNILDGRYSLADFTDKALFEQRLEAPEWLARMSYKGLPDIRIIVHNLIPVMAMLRLPTQVSHGKANLHMGGLGVGIHIATGELLHIAQHNRIVSEIPDFGPIKGIQIPDWQKLLLIASRVQQITNLGFAAVDLTLDKNMGPVLLEINARAGLSVQVANLAPLRRRLERVEGIHVGTPEKGVRIAQDIFGKKVERELKDAPKKMVIGAFEPVELAGSDKKLKILAKIDPHTEKSVLDRTLEAEGFTEGGKCKFSLKGKRLITLVKLVDLGSHPYKMIVGKRDLGDFWIDPFQSESTQKESAPKKRIHELRDLDRELNDLDRQIHLLAHLRPVNLEEEKETFLADPTYNPQFKYGELSFDPAAIRARVEKLTFPDNPLGILFKKKSEEILLKTDLLRARGSASFTDYAKKLIEPPSSALSEEALDQIRSMPGTFPQGPVMTAKEAKKRCEQALREAGLIDWKVELQESMVADISAGKEKTLFLRSAAEFTEHRLQGILAHEIETHVFTTMNGAEQPYRLFHRGLAGYLITQEGLAVYNEERVGAVEAFKKYGGAFSVIGIQTALENSFAETYAILRRYGLEPERALKVTLKAKRGLADTAQPGGFTKDMVYFVGKKKILAFIKGGGDLKDLYIGKINADDLPLIKKIQHLKPQRYLPDYLKQAER